MNIQFTLKAQEAHEAFGLTEAQAERLMRAISQILARVWVEFPNNYATHDTDGTFKPDLGQILTEALAAGSNDQEKSFLLFISSTGLQRMYEGFDESFERI